MLRALSPQRRRLAVATACIALLAAAAILVTTRPWQSTTRRSVSQQSPGPVLLVPGYGGSTSALDSLAAALREAGKRVEIMTLPDGGTGDLIVQAKALGTAAAALIRSAGSASIDVVGYSAGGVVARLWAQDDGGARIARRIITIGSPHHGTELASLGTLLSSACPIACQQLVVDSELLVRLDAEPLTGGPTFVSIWSTSDDVVLPADSAELSGALNLTVQSVCARSTVRHSALPTDATVQGMVRAELGAGPPVVLTSAQCASVSS